MIFKKAVFYSLLISTTILQACSTTSGGAGGVGKNTAVNKAIGNCVAGIAVSAVSGAVIGAVLGGGSRSVQQGAITGAAIGVGRCAILLELAAAEDKQKLQQAQLAALQTNETTTQSFQTQSGRVAKVTTKVTPAPPPKPKSKPKPKQIASTSTPVETISNPASTTNTTEIAESVTPLPVESKPVIVNGQAQTETKQQTSDTAVSETAFFDEQPSTVECKFTELLIDMDGSSTDTGKQKWCRENGGGWEPVIS